MKRVLVIFCLIALVGAGAAFGQAQGVFMGTAIRSLEKPYHAMGEEADRPSPTRWAAYT